jgi:hypothetical protein
MSIQHQASAVFISEIRSADRVVIYIYYGIYDGSYYSIRSMYHVWSKELQPGFWWGNLRKRPRERPRGRWEDNHKWTFKN